MRNPKRNEKQLLQVFMEVVDYATSQYNAGNTSVTWGDAMRACRFGHYKHSMLPPVSDVAGHGELSKTYIKRLFGVVLGHSRQQARLKRMTEPEIDDVALDDSPLISDDGATHGEKEHVKKQPEQRPVLPVFRRPERKQQAGYQMGLFDEYYRKQEENERRRGDIALIYLSKVLDVDAQVTPEEYAQKASDFAYRFLKKFNSLEEV